LTSGDLADNFHALPTHGKLSSFWGAALFCALRAARVFFI